MPSKKTSSCLCCQFRKHKSLLYLLIIILIVAIYFAKGLFIAAFVNSKPVFRWTVIKQLEKQGGKKVLDTMATKILINEEAKKQKVTISDEEINSEIKNIESRFTEQGQKLDDILKSQNMTLNDLKEEIKLQKIVEKLAGKDVVVSDQEIEDYLTKNKSLLPSDTPIETLRQNVKQQLSQQKASEKVQAWVKELQDKAKIIYFSKTYQK